MTSFTLMLTNMHFISILAAQSHGLDITAGVFPTIYDTGDASTSTSTKAQRRKDGASSSGSSSSSSSSSSSGSGSGSRRIGEGASQRKNSHSSHPDMLTDYSSDVIIAAATSTGADLNLILFDEVSRVQG